MCKMKRLSILLLMLIASATYLKSQDIVSTDPENKKVVLEEFTGINCGYCPQGHAIAQGIKDAHPDDVVVIAVHAGGYADPSGSQPDYRTPFGAAIDGQASVGGYPAGTVNRHYFSNWAMSGGTAMGRSYWTSASNLIIGEESYVNVGIEATIVSSTRQLVVNVEVYYTGDSPKSTNKLNVALLQDNIVGYQASGGSNYNHRHMLRWMLTGQWGVEITETTEGSFYKKTFTYEIPEDYNDIAVVLEDLQVVAFVAETSQEIISGNFVHEINYVESNDYDAAILMTSIPQTACSENIEPVVLIKNYGVVELTSLEFKYSINEGEQQTFSWTGNLLQNEELEVVLPEYFYVPSDNNVINIECELPNGNEDQLPQNDYSEIDFYGSQNFPDNIKFGVKIEGNPEQVTWNIVDSEGLLIEEGGPYTSAGFYTTALIFPGTGCYMLTLNDDSGEGLSGGRYIILDNNNDILWEGTKFTYSTKAELAYGVTVDIEDNLAAEDVKIFPNPVNGAATIEFNVDKDSDANIAMYDVLGKNVMNIYNGKLQCGSNKINLNTSGISKGVYFVRIESGKHIVSKKIVVN